MRSAQPLGFLVQELVELRERVLAKVPSGGDPSVAQEKEDPHAEDSVVSMISTRLWT